METKPMPNEPQQPKPRLTRREALKTGAFAAALGAGALALNQGLRPAAGASPQQAAANAESLVKTTCGLCTSGCGLEVRVVGGRAVKVEGNPLHPLNQGVCCLRGQCALEMLYSPERLAHPRIQRGARGSGDWQEVSWDEALQYVADKLGALRAANQPHKLALLHGELRGQMRSLVNRWMQAYGSPNVIGRESLGEQAVRQAMFLSQGVNGLPAYDLTNASYVMTFGGNLLETSRNVINALGTVAFMRRGRPQRGKLVAVHPRLNLTGVKADEWIPIRPGTYAALALGMANVILNSQLYDEAFVRDFTFGFDDFQDASGSLHLGFKRLVLEQYTLERASQITGIKTEIIARLAGEFAANRPAVAVLPTEPGELNSGNALYTALAVHALNALVGSIDAKGGVMTQRFPLVADWPAYAADAIGAAGLEQPRLDGAGSSELPLAASVYQNLPAAILADQPYDLQALLLLNANPLYDLPDDGRTVEALLKIPFVVSFAPTLDESAALADVILPASTFMEQWGDDYIEGVGYAGVSLRRPVVEPVTDSRSPADALLALAARQGGPLAAALPYPDYQAAVKQRLAGAPLEWDKLDANGFWAEMVYFHAQPGSPAWSRVVGRDRLNAPQDGRYDFFSRELHALFSAGAAPAPQIDQACLPHFELPAALDESSAPAQEYPYLLISQPLITQSPNWQGVLPTLQEAVGLQGHVRWESWIEINPATAKALGVEDGQVVTVESPSGQAQAPVRLQPGLWPNAVFMPAGMGHHTLTQWGRRSPRQSVVGANPAQLAVSASEPLSGQAVTGPVRVKIVTLPLQAG